MAMILVMTTKLPPASAQSSINQTMLTNASLPLPTSEQSVRSIRLAIGSLGLPDEEHNNQLGDLLAAGLTSAEGFDLVERRSLETALRELELNFSGLVRAGDAVRAGHLLRADWFLLGTATQVNGTNAILARIVDVRTGIIRDLAVFREPAQLPILASELTDFVRRSGQTTNSAESHVYLAIGGFEDLSVNNRLASFPVTLRASLAASYQGSKVTLLERELVNALLKEVRLDLAGLTSTNAESAAALPAEMQSAFWIVDGFYQSYETSGPEVDLVLRVERVLGARHLVSLRDRSADQLFRRVRESIDTVMAKDNALVNFPTRRGEIEAQMVRGKERGRMGENELVLMPGTQKSFLGGFELADDPVKKRRNIEEAIQAFEAVVLLDPENREAKMYLAACLQYAPLNQIEEARNYYREMIGSQVTDKWSHKARLALAYSYYDLDNKKALELFQTFEDECTDPKKAGEFASGLEMTLQRLRIQGDITTEEMLPYIDRGIIARFQTFRDLSGVYKQMLNFEINSVLHAFRFDRVATAKHVEQVLLPKLKERFPEMKPYIFLRCVIYEDDTNSPVIQEFRDSLEWCASNPDKILFPKSYFEQLMWDPYSWAFKSKLYDLVIRMAEIRQQAATKGFSGDLTSTAKIQLAYAYMDQERWQHALEIFESFGDHTLNLANLGEGPWGSPFKPLSPVLEAQRCRQHLGLAAAKTNLFELGQPLVESDAPIAFASDGDGAWIAEGNKLFRIDPAGNKSKVVPLPKKEETWVTCLWNGPGKIWIGTTQEGLIEYDENTRSTRRFTEDDGLLLNDISSLQLQKDTLWIGFSHRPSNSGGQGFKGGLGKMDLRTYRITSLTPPLLNNASISSSARGHAQDDAHDAPPRGAVVSIAEGTPGELWMAVWEKGIQRYNLAANTWETFQTSDTQNFLTSLAANPQQVVAGCTDPSIANEKSTRGGLSRLSSGDTRSQNFYVKDGLPATTVTALALDGRDVWVGGAGYIAIMDLDQKKISKVCYVPARRVDRIQIASGCAWIQMSGSLYRVPTVAIKK
jgi:tetratricopeptide (TPR) repeat protein